MLATRRLILGGLAAGLAVPARAADGPSREQVLATMRRATAFMTDKAAVHGGYVWSYLPDFSRRWGELEAKPTMVWVQPPGTGTMGHLFLDAFHATGDEAYYVAAAQSAQCLMDGQLPSGGWNYLIDFGGEASKADWYATTGANAWRMEEFQHDWGNGTFDNAGTSEAMQFLLRIYLEKREARFKPALDRAVDFVLNSQHPNGGWPQRWPAGKAFTAHGADYTGHITFNDDVAGENIKFLVMLNQTLGDPRAVPAIRRAMDVFLITQQPTPQPGWGLQHRLNDLKPSAARSYEPEALATHTTATNLAQLMSFYELTGDPKYLARVAEGLDWLAKVALPEPRNGRTHPTFIEIGTDRPLYVHRRGSNVVNGAYYVDGDPERTLGHYGAFRAVRVDGLRKRYEKLKATPPEEVAASSPLTHKGSLPRYFANQDLATSDLNGGQSMAPLKASPQEAARLVADLNTEGWWPTPLVATSHPYKGPGPATPTPGDYATTHVGDAYDTSPYPTDTPVLGISTSAFIKNMGLLIGQLDAGG
ncbi:pectate lyase [Phenylobacterium sp.]|uniref:pectate lyase n=1 Tax=Phenylobacterium sp. TaxID=1871053 RepID=UPI00286ACD17|nr:pectate lyase [Phenylobacterium sp.]